MSNTVKKVSYSDKCPSGNLLFGFAALTIVVQAILAIVGRYILFADGSYMTLVLAQNKNFFINSVEWNRSLSYVITQFLPVALANSAKPSLSIISYAYGFSCVAIPAAVFIATLKRFRHSPFAPIVYISCPLLFGSALLICVSTSLIGATLQFALFSYLYFNRNLRPEYVAYISMLFPIASLLGDSFLPFVPVFLITIFYLNFDERKIYYRGLLFFGLLIGMTINFVNLFQRSQGNSLTSSTNGVISDQVFLQNPQLALLLCMSLLAGIAIYSGNSLRFILLFFTAAIGLIALNVGPKNGYAIFASRYILTFGLVVLSMALLFLKVDLSRLNHASLKVFSTLVSVVVLVSQLQVFLPFQGFLDKMDEVSSSCIGTVPFSSANFTESEGLYVWSYTNPSLSRIFWDKPNGCLLQNSSPESWQPFVPGDSDPLTKPIYVPWISVPLYWR
jgi:hypothetical protein